VPSLASLTPAEFELAVKAILDGSGISLLSYESQHLRRIEGLDGEYVIDIVATFEALGARFMVLVECKHEKRPVERQDVQVLRAKLESTGAHKGIVFSIAGFQRGAQEYAEAHGIALAEIVEGQTLWHTRSEGPPSPPPLWVKLPKYAAWLWRGSIRSLMSPDFGEYTRSALGVGESAA
jgi:restriction system protein